MTTSSPLPSTSNAKPHLSLSVGPTPRPPPSLASASPSAQVNSRRIASWGSVNLESGFSAMGERGMTPLPSPMDSREWGYLPTEGGGSRGSWGRSQGKRWFGSNHGGEDSPSLGGGGKSWMSNFHQSPTPASYSHHASHSTNQPTYSTVSRDRSEPSRSKTLSFFDSSSPVIPPSTSNSSLTDPSLVLSPPPNPPSRNNSLNTRSNVNTRPRSSSRLSISDLPDQPDPLRSSTTSTSSWLNDFNPTNGGVSWGKRDRGTSIGSWSSEVERAARLRSETASTTESDAGGTGQSTPVERRLFMDLGGTETVRNSPDRPVLPQLDTSFSTSPEKVPPAHKRERSISATSNGSTSALLPQKPLSSLPTAIEDPSHPFPSPTNPSNPRSRFLNHHHHSPPSYKDSPPPPIDLSSLKKRNFLAPTDLSTATPRTPPSMEELQKIIGGTTISSEKEEEDAKGAVGRKEGPGQGDRVGEYKVVRVLGKGAFSRVALARKGEGTEVALKLIERGSCERNERMRISVLREVEVLKNISHPSLVTLSSSFLTPLYTVLVLDYCPGGELFDFLASYHSLITEGLARRMFGELCDAVGWMHRVGLVHRDIKLENILLTSRLFPLPLDSNPLDHLASPFLKLTDFGLSRFINPSSPLLQTRCGSEAYAAPELLMGKLYDGRLTDSWAVGVVLYALVTGGLPFVEEEETSRERFEGLERRVSTRGGRKGYLLKIAKGEYSWPEKSTGLIQVGGELRDLVGRLLVRDPSKRWRIDGSELWESEWMRGEGQVRRVEGTVRTTIEELNKTRGAEMIDFNETT